MTAKDSHEGLTIHNYFTEISVPALSTVKWTRSDAVLLDSKGKERFRQNGIEHPDWWPENTVRVVAEKYFRVKNGEKENSARQMFSRVADWITDKGKEQNILNGENKEVFREELLYLLVHGMFAFNSPVWFNVGVVESPQCSACFIQSVEDSMDSIMELAKREVMLFKGGSGTGSNLSPLRSSWEELSGGGRPSGPVSFMKGYDSWAGVTKSGGTTRRAAKLVALDIGHPDIYEQFNGEPGFITCKARAEEVAQALYSTGKYSAEWNVPGNVYEQVSYQNANNSVRVKDHFMHCVENDDIWETRAVTTGAKVKEYKASFLFNSIAESAWICGCPGLQFDTTINKWNTCSFTGRINAANPCSEFMFLDDTACNLGSLNLLKFAINERSPDKSFDKSFDLAGFKQACRIAITAMDIIVEASSYPSPKITDNSHKYRPLGLGYANLGALLTYWGIPYDSDAGRSVAASITSIMTATAYDQSASLAEVVGPFEMYKENSDSMLHVIVKHQEATRSIKEHSDPLLTSLLKDSNDSWARTLRKGKKSGFRNSQATVLAPTGTISFLLAADTTGIEPMLGVVQYKKMVGEGYIRIPNTVIEPSLHNLGYDKTVIFNIMKHIEETGNIHNAEELKSEHSTVFAQALGAYSLRPEAHVDMVCAVQPFVSGSISKTVNVLHETTVEDIASLYKRAWRNGAKCISIYRDGCKLSQPISDKKKKEEDKILPWGNRRRLPNTRISLTHKFKINDQKGYFTAGFYPNGRLGELFVQMAKQGSTLNGIMDAWAMSISLGLQHGVPLESFAEKFCGMRFEPDGVTGDPKCRIAKSLPDYIFTWLTKELENKNSLPEVVKPPDEIEFDSPSWDGPPCAVCGHLTKRAGTCFVCPEDGTTSGCS